MNGYNKAFELKISKDGKPQVKGKNESRMPMCLCVLLSDVQRAAREAYIHKMALKPTPKLPDCVGCGYEMQRGLQIIRVSGNAYPSFLTVEEYEIDESESEEGKESDINDSESSSELESNSDSDHESERDDE